jgi:hypothetical protein
MRVLYAAKCFWPGVDVREVELVGAQVSADNGVGYHGALLFADDELVLYMFETSLPAAVRSACERAGAPWERVMAAVWLAPAIKPTREGGWTCA